MSKTNINVTFPWATILFIVFLVLKLTDVIDWSWWWVTAPLWIPIVLIALVFVFTMVVIGIASLVQR